MRLTFKRLEIHNFMAFADEIFDFDKQNGLNLICGKNNDIPGSKNGVGKSCLTEALVYSVYGQTRNNIKNGNIWNKFVGSKEMRVVSYFDVDKESYKSVNGFNKHGAPYCQIFHIENGKEIDLTKSTIVETRKFVANEILHCDIDIFLRTILLTSDQTYNFFRLSKGEKKQFIEKLFDISMFGEMYNMIHRDILDIDKDIASKQSKLLVLNNNKDTYQTKYMLFEKDKNSKLKQLKSELSEIQNAKDKLQHEVIQSNEAEVAKFTIAKNAVEKKINELEDKKWKIQCSIQTNDNTISKLDESSKQKQKIIDKHATLMNKLCEDCRPIFSDYYNISSLEKEIYNNSIERQKTLNKKLELNETISKLDKNINDYSSKFDLIVEKMSKLTSESSKHNSEIQKLLSKISTIENNIAHLENSDNPYQELFDSNELQLNELSKQLDFISEKYRYYKFAESIVSQDTIRKFIIGDLVCLLNNKLKMYLTKFGAKYHVEFDADMNYEFKTSVGSYEYDNFSAGERARLMIASCFAFRDFMYIRNNISCNILVLDEFIDGAIDSLAIESILNLLKEFVKMYNQNVFVISHRKEIDNTVFDHIIQMVKTNDISKITYLE